ncbi:hypothetical protein ACFLZ9_00550 [Patescibacteria group bacterium]
MSTVRTNIQNNRFLTLQRMGEAVFHVSDLANIWEISSKNTLHTTLKRYTKQGLLSRVYRGLYSILPIDKIDPYLLGVKAMHEYCYISAETVLEQEGIIMQATNYITLINSRSKKFSIGNNNYYSRQLSDKYLFQNEGIEKKNGINIATTERAVADLLYFNPRAYFDAAKKINWKEVKRIQKKIGYKYK